MKKSKKNIVIAFAATLLLILATTIALAGDNGGNYVSFNGTNYLDIVGYSGITGTNSRTVEAWINTSSSGGYIFEWGTNSAGQRWSVRTNPNAAYGIVGALRLEVQSGWLTGSTVITDGNWHHVSVVLADDGSPDVQEVILYVDGDVETISSSSAQAINTGTTIDVTIGYSPAFSGRYFTGLIDEVRIWSTARTAEQINATMFTNLNPGAESNLEVYYDFTDLPGSCGSYFPCDESGNNRHGTNHNSVLQFGGSTAPIWDKAPYSHDNMAGVWGAHITDVSYGMTVTDNTFLGELGDDIIFGVSADDPSNPNVNTDLPTTGDWATAPDPARWSTVWYCDLNDPTGDGGTVDITFDYDVIKSLFMPDDTTVANYRLLERPGTTGDFSEIAIASSVDETERTVTFAGVETSVVCSYLTLGTLDNTNSPTAISLTSLTATVARNTWIPIALVLVALATVGTLTIVRRKRQQG